MCGAGRVDEREGRRRVAVLRCWDGAGMRQTKPDSGPGFQVEVFKILQGVECWDGAGCVDECEGRRFLESLKNTQ